MSIKYSGTLSMSPGYLLPLVCLVYNKHLVVLRCLQDIRYLLVFSVFNTNMLFLPLISYISHECYIKQSSTQTIGVHLWFTNYTFYHLKWNWILSKVKVYYMLNPDSYVETLKRKQVWTIKLNVHVNYIFFSLKLEITNQKLDLVLTKIKISKHFLHNILTNPHMTLKSQ